MISIWNTSGASAQPDLQPIVDLTCLMGSERFPSALLGCLGHWVKSQHFNVLLMEPEQPSLMLAGTCHSDDKMVWRCWNAYSKHFHNYDELFNRMQRQKPRDTPLIGHILAEDIQFKPYRQGIYQNNGMSERLSSLSRDHSGTPLLLNLYRHQDSGYFSDREIHAFEQLTPALLQLVKGHLALRRGSMSVADWRPLLLQHAPQLTEQEQEVCLLLLQGLTHAGIGATLGIKESTVKTYRNRAFDRLGISFRSQLFALVRRN